MANKGTLLYGNMDKGSADTSGAVQFITKLLEAVTTIHKVHLMTTGPGSFAAHEALGEVYGNLEDSLDNLAESYMGCTQNAITFEGVETGSYSAEVRKIYEYVEANRGMMGPESHIQNLIDEILDQLARDLFKLDRLA
jgi:DNA-binding ferritin-like protein